MIRLLRLPGRALHKVRGCLVSLLLLLLLGLVALCGALAFGLGRASAAEPEGSVLLLLDSSNSVWEYSDPAGLRVEAARLVIAQLGVDASTPYRLGVITFGSEATLAAPLTALDDAAARRVLEEAIASASPMGWTDTQRALDLARETLAGSESAPRAILLLTDGLPATEATQEATAATAYQAALLETLSHLATSGVAVHVVLLAPDAAALAEVEPWWISATTAFPNVQLYHAVGAAALPGIYHAIAATLRGAESAGAVVEDRGASREPYPVQVEPGLAEVTLLVRKEVPDLQVRLADPQGRVVAARDAQVHVARDGATERWTIPNPVPGTWQIWLEGAGEVTVWKEVRRATATVALSHTPVPSATRPPAPTRTSLAVVVPGSRAEAGDATPITGHRGPSAGGAALVIGGALLIAAAGTVALRRRRHLPTLEGMLRLLEGDTARRGQRWPLDSLNQSQLTIGGASADITLDGVTGPPATLVARRDGAGTFPELLPHDELYLNGRPVSAPQPLWDRDEIRLGPNRLRYENVRRRRTARRELPAGLTTRRRDRAPQPSPIKESDR